MKIALLTSDNRESARDYGNPDPQIGLAPEALLQGFTELNGIEVHVVSCLQQPVRAPEKLAPNIWYHGMHVPKMGWMRTSYQGCVRAIRKKLREIGPDIVHGQGTERDCGISAALSGFPNLVTVHGNMRAIAKLYRARFGNYYWITARLESWVLRRTGGVFCNSQYTEALVAPVAKRVWRVPNAVRREFFAKTPAYSPEFVPVLLNVGGIIPYKRQLEILEVARRLWNRGYRFKLIFAGAVAANTDYGAEFLRQIAEAELAGFGKYVGLLKLKDLIAAMDNASAMVHFPNEESFGLVVAEALARNLKMFVPALGGIPDIAASLEGVEVLAADDWFGLEKAIATWIENGHPRPNSTAEIMRRRYYPKVIAERHIDRKSVV